MAVKKKTAKKKVTKKKTLKEKAAEAKVKVSDEAKALVKSYGRPTKYRKDYDDYLMFHLAQGLSFEIFGACLPDYDPTAGAVALSTVQLWCEKHESFSVAKKRGWELCQAFYEKEGVKGLWGGKAFNATTWIFQMKNRFNWTDKKEIEIGEETRASVKLAYNFDEDDEEEK